MSDQPGADAAEVRLNRLLNLILETAVEALGFSAATVTARHTNDMSTVAATDQRLIELDAVQYEDGGPCVQTLDDPSPILLEDASKSDDRWQHFAQTAAHLGVRSSLSLHAPTDSRDLAASLNLYARETFDMSRDNVRLASTYAAQLAATLESVDAYRSTARLAQNLAEAMRSRAVIEQAKGILMADYQINDAEAFQRLAELSQRSNIKLRDVAARFVEERSSGG
jgi:ANTAR domain-containing protein/GAF domain-containing protein